MRVKKDKTSWHASGILARDERHTKDETPEKRSVAKKNTKKWCLGKQGRHHQGEWIKYSEFGHYYILKCKNCSKHLDFCCAFFNRRCNSSKHQHDPNHLPK